MTRTQGVKLVMSKLTTPFMPKKKASEEGQMTTKYEGIWLRQFGGDHYDQPIQPTVFCYVNELDVLESNIVKYISRHKAREKDIKGNGKMDIKKLIHYAEMILEMEYGTDA